MTRHQCTFYVPAVVGWARAGANYRGKHAHVYTQNATRAAESRVRQEFHAACGDFPMAPRDVPVRVCVETYRPIPKSRPKRVVTEPDTFKPDADNISKLVLDALNGIAWFDDRQVTKLSVIKHTRSRDLVTDVTKVSISYGSEDE